MIYNPGNQLGKSVQDGGQRPAKQPGGPFLGKGATSGKSNTGNPQPASANPGQTGTLGGKGKQDTRGIKSNNASRRCSSGSRGISR
jgi:hypothetical protein